jgi:hypothetical protein
MTKQTALLTKEQILSVDDLPSEIIDVPEWGGKVKVRSLTGLERDGLEFQISQQKVRNIRALFVSLSVIDETGNNLFTEDEASVLGKKNSRALDRIFNAAQRLSKLESDSEEELEKN